MKHFLLSIASIFLIGLAAKADTVAFVADGATYDGTGTTVTVSGTVVGDVKFTAGGICSINWTKSGSNSSYVTGSQIRWYANDILNIYPDNGVTITQVTFTDQYSKTPTITASTGNITTTNRVSTWVGETTEQFTIKSTAQLRVPYIEITYTVKEATEKPATPVVKYGDTVVSADEDVTVEEGTAFSVTSNGATSITVTPEGSEPIEITGNSGEFTPEVGEHLFTIVAHNGVGDSDSFMFTATVTERVAPEASNYKLATSTSQLKAGLKVIFVNQEAGKTMSTADNNNNRKTTSIEFTDDKSALLEPSDEVLIVELGGSEDAWTFETTNYAGTNGYFASATSGTNNHLKIQESAMTAKIAFEGSDAVVTFNAGGTFNRTIMRYNSTNDLFACYSSGQQPVQMYIYDSSTTAIDTIVVDNDAEEEYYNLQGVRVNGDVAPGLYIVKKGNEVKKVIVR